MEKRYAQVGLKNGKIVSVNEDRPRNTRQVPMSEIRRRAARKSLRRSAYFAIRLAAMVFGTILFVFVMATLFRDTPAEANATDGLEMGSQEGMISESPAELIEESYEEFSFSPVMLMEEPSEPETPAEILPVPDVPGTDFKTFMDYRCITAASSGQYALQKTAATGQYGIRYYGDLPMIAVGTYYTDCVSTVVRVHLENGKTFDAMVGDIKDDEHTTETNQVMPNGNCVEFIVDTKSIPAMCRAMGDMSFADKQYSGRVVGIEILQDAFL